MTQRTFTGDAKAPIEDEEMNQNPELAGLTVTHLLKEMTSLTKKMRQTGEHTEPSSEPATEREQRLQDVYTQLEKRGVVIDKNGNLEPEKIEVSAIREQVEEFLAKEDNADSIEDGGE